MPRLRGSCTRAACAWSTPLCWTSRATRGAAASSAPSARIRTSSARWVWPSACGAGVLAAVGHLAGMARRCPSASCAVFSPVREVIRRTGLAALTPSRNDIDAVPHSNGGCCGTCCAANGNSAAPWSAAPARWAVPAFTAWRPGGEAAFCPRSRRRCRLADGSTRSARRPCARADRAVADRWRRQPSSRSVPRRTLRQGTSPAWRGSTGSQQPTRSVAGRAPLDHAAQERRRASHRSGSRRKPKIAVVSLGDASVLTGSRPRAGEPASCPRGRDVRRRRHGEVRGHCSGASADRQSSTGIALRRRHTVQAPHHREPARGGARHRSPVRGPGNLRAGQCARCRVGPRRAGRHRRRRSPFRRRESRRQAAGHSRAQRGPAADVLQRQAFGTPRLPLRQQRAALPVRLGAGLFDIRDGRTALVGRGDGHRGFRPGLGRGAQHGCAAGDETIQLASATR